jgi:hypothetical protein
MSRAFLKYSLLEHLCCLFFKFSPLVLTLGRAYFVEGEPESENPLPQAYVEVYMLIVIYLTVFIVIEQYLGSENVCLDEMK